MVVVVVVATAVAVVVVAVAAAAAVAVAVVMVADLRLLTHNSQKFCLLYFSGIITITTLLLPSSPWAHRAHSNHHPHPSQPQPPAWVKNRLCVLLEGLGFGAVD